MQKIVLLGAGNFAREVVGLINDLNRVEPQFDLVGFLDDNPNKHGNKLNGTSILGGMEWLKTNEAQGVKAVCAIGESHIRRKVVLKALEYGSEFCNLIHPNVVLTSFIEFGQGVIITAGCILTCNIKIGNHVHLNLSTTVGHDDVLEDFVTTAPGVHLSGNVNVGEGVYIGTGAVTVEKLSIGDWSIIGAGAVVAKNIPDNVTAVGVPAKPIKTREPGWYLT
jgi:sugar O-acyltransferase (sialic acid O-acetyltransferase NeuD family)